MGAAKTLLMAFATATCFAASAQTAARLDVLITEIMADPTPVVGLPNAEYLELRNVSATAVDLNGWRISDATGTAIIAASFLLQPDSTVILCANSNVAAFSVHGRTIGVSSFPSLDNAGELLTLISLQNIVIHAVDYTVDWYGNEAKKEGGWSLEMIDPVNPCTGKENWKASIDSQGGTPGKINSVNGTNSDTIPPQAKKAYAIDSVTVMVVFNEPLDITSAAAIAHYNLTGITITAATPLSSLFHTVQLKLNAPLQVGTIYNLTVNGVTDCGGNAVGSYNNLKIGLPQTAAVNDVVINEILFNPKSGGYDYVEFYNRSAKIIDVSFLYIANRNGSGAVGSLKKLTEEPFYLFPGEYLLATQDKMTLQMHYHVKNEDAVLQLSYLPSYPNDKGIVVLQSLQGDVLDEVSYTKDWHFALLSNAEGVSLERVDPNSASQNAANWHSAASTAGYGTPSYQNSQYKQTENIRALVEVSPNIFSPDNDGRDDIATISYQVEKSGYIANVLIFDASGRLIRHLAKNDLLSQKGFWKWDGLGEKLNKLPIGTYVVFTEIFNLEGKKKSFKNTIVLARKLN